MSVSKSDIIQSLKELGLRQGDIVLVHSSLKSFGYVEGGADTVIDAFLEVVGETGTLVMPTLSIKNFDHVYEEWSLDRPSDVGLITETFRKRKGVLRSNQETHSVAAFGLKAEEITGSHKSYGPIYGIFGDYSFGYSSPWQKMYDMNGKVVFLGVNMRKNTFKHFVEYRFVENLLDNVTDVDKRAELKSRVRYHTAVNGKDVVCGSIWPIYEGADMKEVLDKNNMITKSTCGEALLQCIDIKETCDFTYNLLHKEYSSWYKGDVLQWIEECKNNSR